MRYECGICKKLFGESEMIRACKNVDYEEFLCERCYRKEREDGDEAGK